jgi:hypothetical protein
MRTYLQDMMGIWDSTTQKTLKSRLATTYGINHRSILLELRSLYFPRSFPVDVMHCILLNVLPKILELWQGKRFEDEKKKPTKEKKTAEQPPPPSAEAL